MASQPSYFGTSIPMLIPVSVLEYGTTLLTLKAPGVFAMISCITNILLWREIQTNPANSYSFV